MLHLCFKFQISISKQPLALVLLFFWVFETGTSGLETVSLVKTRFSSIHFVELIEQEVCN